MLPHELRVICIGLFAVIIIALLAYKDRSHPKSFTIPFEKFEAQPDDITCGPTCGVMLLRYYGTDVKVNDLKSKTKTAWFSWNGKDVGMTAPIYLRAGIEAFGQNAVLGYGTLDRLKSLVARGKPCIVLLRSSEYSWHYVLVTGYESDVIYFANPTDGKLQACPEKDFVGAWNWTSDMYGRDCSGWVWFWLRTLEVYPYSIVYVD